MDLVLAAQYIELIVGVLLLTKLFWLGLHKHYSVFCCFLIADLCGSAVYLVNNTAYHFDYRRIWLADRVIVWILMFWTIIALLNAILANYPGILRVSRNILRFILVAVFVLGLVSAIPEYASVSSSRDVVGWLSNSVAAGYVIERVVSSVSLACLLAMLLFLLWFPVEIPRNLAAFCVGFVIYFMVATGIILASNYRPKGILELVNVTASSVEAACLAYWFLVLSKNGEVARSRLSVRRKESERVMGHLEKLNQSLVRSSRR